MTEPVPDRLMLFLFIRRYSVRFVIGAVLAAVVCGAIGVYTTFRREQRIAQKIEAFGGTVEWQYAGPDWIPKTAHERLRYLHRIESVGLRIFVSDWHGNYAGEKTIKVVPLDVLGDIGTLSSLKRLFAKYTDVNDDGLKRLSPLTAIEDLDLEGTKVTDRGLEHLKLMQRLKYLVLAETGVSMNGKDSLKTALPGCDIQLERFFLL